MEEVWKPVKGYEGLYEISSCWRVRSVDRRDQQGRFHNGKLLKLRKSEIYDGLFAKFSKNGVRKEKDIRYIMVNAFKDRDDLQEILSHAPDFK